MRLCSLCYGIAPTTPRMRLSSVYRIVRTTLRMRLSNLCLWRQPPLHCFIRATFPHSCLVKRHQAFNSVFGRSLLCLVPLDLGIVGTTLRLRIFIGRYV